MKQLNLLFPAAPFACLGGIGRVSLPGEVPPVSMTGAAFSGGGEQLVASGQLAFESKVRVVFELG